MVSTRIGQWLFCVALDPQQQGTGQKGKPWPKSEQGRATWLSPPVTESRWGVHMGFDRGRPHEPQEAK